MDRGEAGWVEMPSFNKLLIEKLMIGFLNMRIVVPDHLDKVSQPAFTTSISAASWLTPVSSPHMIKLGHRLTVGKISKDESEGVRLC